MLIRLLVLAALGYLVLFLFRVMLRRPQSTRPGKRTEVDTVQDPVCGVYVTRDEAIVGKLENGEKLFFCSTECLDKYRESLADKNT